MTDKKLVEIYRQTQSYAKTAEKLGMSRQTVRNRVLLLRANGVELPSVKKQRKFSLNLGGSAQG